MMHYFDGLRFVHQIEMRSILERWQIKWKLDRHWGPLIYQIMSLFISCLTWDFQVFQGLLSLNEDNYKEMRTNRKLGLSERYRNWNSFLRILKQKNDTWSCLILKEDWWQLYELIRSLTFLSRGPRANECLSQALPYTAETGHPI